MSSPEHVPEKIQPAVTGDFTNWLIASNGSIVFSTGIEGKVMLVGWDGMRVGVMMKSFPRPMGLAASGQRLWMTNMTEVVSLADAPALAAGYEEDLPTAYDSLFLPRVRYATGKIDAHDLAIGSDGPWVVATRFNCLARLSDRFNFVPAWRPPFITGPNDRCHLNGLAMVDGKPGFVTALATTDEPGAWRENRFTSGVVMSVADGSIRLRGLCMPHSPRWHDGRLWLLNSGAGELWQVNPETGTHTVVCELRGYARGLRFVGQYALVGLCQIRERHLYAGMPVLDKYGELICGVAVVDLNRGVVVGTLELTSGCREVYDVEFLPGIRRPMILNADQPAQGEPICTPNFSGWMVEDAAEK